VSEHADVLIVGAGASGGVAALRLARAGMRVVCLEQGEWQDSAQYPGAGPDWELQARKQWTSSPNERAAPADYPIDFTRSDMVLGNFNGVGGGTILYSAVWPRLLPSNFRTRTEHGVADDWPLSYEELAPYYEETDRQFGVSGLGGNPAYPPGADPPLPPLPIGRAGLALARAHARLGWHWWPESNAILSADHDGRHACVQRGSCGSGCNEGAKGSTDVTHWPRALAAGAQLVTGARVRRVEIDGRGRARGATWIDADGREHFEAADVVLCAANGIGTARLLLLSAHAGAPDGLANSSGLVGRRLMVHPGVMVDGYFDDDLQSHRGHFGGQIQSLEFGPADPSRGFAGSTRWSLAPTGGPVAAAFGLRGRVVFGREHHEHHRSRFGRGARWVVLCEDLPDVEHRVELSGDLLDSSGIPAPAVHYRLSDDARAAIAWSTERATESLLEAGARTVDSAPMRTNSHLLGTARMGDDPTTSVVDRWGVAHDVPNLAIVDGSVFVTVGAANPTSTICALALRAVEHLLDDRGAVTPPEPARSFAVTGLRTATDTARTTSIAVGVTEEARARMGVFADALLPGDERMPGAADAGVAGELLDAVLRARPDLADDLRRALAHEVADAWTSLDELKRTDAPAYRALVLLVLAAYYRAPDVQARIGWNGPVATPVGRFDFPEYLSEGLLDHLVPKERT
jgi:choline dehydrogenase-like flavoprotein